MKTIKNHKHFYFDLGLFFLIYMAILITISMLLFFIGITISPAHTLISLLLTILSFKMLKKENILQITIISIVIACLFIMISGNVIDTSYDGNAYRKPMVGLLKEGWNPVYETPEEFNAKLGSLPSDIGGYGGVSLWLWMDIFPKGMEVIESSIYAITQNIETGKAIQFFFILVVFCFYYDYISTQHLNKIFSMGIAALMALNPVFLSQMRTFYVDAALNHLVMIAVILIIMFFDEEYFKGRRKQILLLMGISIILSISIKFNGILYMGVCYLMFFGLYIFWVKKYQNNFNISAIKVFASLAFSTVGSFIIGFSPYITNYLRYKEFLPGITGTLVPKVTGAFTPSTEGLANFQIFLGMIFSKMGDFWDSQSLPLKIPFTFSKEELTFYYVHAPHFGAYGIFFSGIFILSLLIVIIFLYKTKQILLQNKLLKITVILITVLLFLCTIVPLGLGGLRYVGYFYMIVPFTLFLLLYYLGRNKTKLVCIVVIVFNMVIFLNIIPWAKVFIDTYKESIKTNKDFSIISQNAFENDKILEVGFVRTPEEGCSGYLYNLKDYGIKCGKIVKTSDQSDKPIYYTCGWQISFYLEDFLRE